MALAGVRARVEQARAAGGEGLALALIELAEAEPLFGHRQAAVRAPLDEAAALLDQRTAPALEGRVLLRLAHVKLSEGDFEGVEQLVARARQRLDPADADRASEADCLLVRAAIRRREFAAAEAGLIELSDRLGAEPETLVARRALAAIALAWAELAVEQEHYAQGQTRLDVLPSGAPDEGDDELAEADFACRQLRGALAAATGDQARGCHVLREAVGIAKRFDALEDELEMRIALAGALVQRDDQVGRDEAERHLQITRDKALEHELDSLYLAALMGQAGVLAQNGKTQGALDRCLEIAKVAVSKQDLPRYVAAVALMSGIYERKGDLASAYRTFAEAHAMLREKLGDQARDLIRPPMSAFADRIGPEKFAEIAETVNKAAHARQTFRRRS